MSYIDETGITHNSFYETDSDLGIKPKTEEELREYKRLIGMPLAEDYDELISCLKPNVSKRKRFDDYDFIRLFLALLSKNGFYKINTVKLSYQLVDFYKLEEFKDILVMPVKRQIERDFVDLSECINQAHFYGLLSNPIQSSDERLIWSANLEDVILSYDEQTVLKMNILAEKYIQLSKGLAESVLELHNELTGITWDMDMIKRRFCNTSLQNSFVGDNPGKCDSGSPVSILMKTKK